MSTEQHFRSLERLYNSAAINDYFRPRIAVSHSAAEIVIPVRADFFHAAHAVHGSIYFKALDDAAFFAANSIVEDVFVLTVSLTIHLLRPVTSGEIRALGKLVNASRRLLVAESQAYDSADRLVAHGVGTFMRSDIALTPAVGYV